MRTQQDPQSAIDRGHAIWIAYKLEKDRATALGVLASYKRRLRSDPDLREWAANRYRITPPDDASC